MNNKWKTWLRSAALAIPLSAFTLNAFADASIYIAKDPNDPSSKTPLYISDGKITVKDPQQPNAQVMFDSKKQVMTVLNHANKTYTELNPKTMEGLANQMNAMQQQMMAQMQSLPPEHREKMKQMMGDNYDKLMGQAASAPKPRLVSTDKTRKIQGYQCKVAEFHMHGEKTSEVCLASADELGISKEDYQTMESFLGFVAEMSKKLPNGDDIMGEFAAWRAEGSVIPIQETRYENGKATTSRELVSVSKDKVDSEQFNIPKNYSKQDLTSMMK